MMQIVTCHNCHKELSTGLKETIWYEFKQQQIRAACKECHHSQEIDKIFSFCSLECTKEFVSKITKEEEKELWKKL